MTLCVCVDGEKEGREEVSRVIQEYSHATAKYCIITLNTKLVNQS